MKKLFVIASVAIATTASAQYTRPNGDINWDVVMDKAIPVAVGAVVGYGTARAIDYNKEAAPIKDVPVTVKHGDRSVTCPMSQVTINNETKLVVDCTNASPVKK